MDGRIANSQGLKQMRRTETRFENDVHTVEIARTTSSSGLTDRFPFRKKNMTAWCHSKAFLEVLNLLLTKEMVRLSGVIGQATRASCPSSYWTSVLRGACLFPRLIRSSIQCR